MDIYEDLKKYIPAKNTVIANKVGEECQQKIAYRINLYYIYV